MGLRSFPHYKQLGYNDCGPVCIKIISKHFGQILEGEFIRGVCHITEAGMSVSDLAAATERIGFRAMVFELSFAQLIEKAILPCIAFIDDKHFVVIYRVTRRYVYVSDPAQSAKKKYEYKYFESRFLNRKSGTGTIICLEPQPSFYNIEPSGKESRRRISYLRITLQYLKPYKSQLIQLMIIMVVLTALQGVTPFVFRSILDIGVDKKNIDFINIMFIANLVILFGTGLANAIKDFINRHIGTRFSTAIISNYLIKLLSLPMPVFQRLSGGEILNKVKDHESIKNFMLYHTTNLTHSLLSFLIFGLILYVFSPKVFVIYFSCIICYIIWVVSFKKYQEKIETGLHHLQNRNNNFWIETARNNADIRSYNLEAYHRKKWEEIQIAIYHQDISSAKIRHRQEAGSHFINGVKNILITFICAKSVVSGDMTFGVFISIQFIVGFLNSPISQFIAFIQAYPGVKQSFLRLSEIHGNKFDSQTPLRDMIKISRGPQEIVFDKVYFRYEDSTGYALKDINISIPYGKTVAIVGRSGSGKSSLINLMLGLFKPNSGNLYIGKFLFSNIDQVQWRECCGVVLQNGKIFNDSIINNIVLKDTEPDYAKFDRIVEMVELKELIQELPQGYFSVIGEKGRKLSYGQKQRILLARALYKEPDYLFLDEATSALDVFNEAVILKRIIEYMENKTLIIATHRINTIKNADQIIVMNDGMIIEQGVHDSLIKKKGTYYTMCSLHDTNNKKD